MQTPLFQSSAAQSQRQKFPTDHDPAWVSPDVWLTRLPTFTI
jgi:hypothetical protein